MADISNRTCTVYGLVASDDRGSIRYVGQTQATLSRRLAQHLAEAKRRQTRRGSWIKSVLARGSEVEIICLVENAQWNVTEIDLIASYRSAGQSLTNQTDGGDGVAHHEADAMAKIVAAVTGRKASAKHIAVAAEQMTARWKDPLFRARFGELMRGRGKSPETKAKMAAASSARKHTNDTKSRLSDAARAAWARPEVRAKSSGANAPGAKLTMEDARTIRIEYATGAYTMAALGKRFMVSGATVHAIVRGCRFKDADVWSKAFQS